MNTHSTVCSFLKTLGNVLKVEDEYDSVWIAVHFLYRRGERGGGGDAVILLKKKDSKKEENVIGLTWTACVAGRVLVMF